MNIFKVIIAGLLAVGVVSQVAIQEDAKFFEDLDNIMGNLSAQVSVEAFFEMEDTDTSVI